MACNELGMPINGELTDGELCFQGNSRKGRGGCNQGGGNGKTALLVCEKIETCVPGPTELSQRWWPDTINADCAKMQEVWGVCTNEDDVNHKDVMAKCPATCALANVE